MVWLGSAIAPLVLGHLVCIDNFLHRDILYCFQSHRTALIPSAHADRDKGNDFCVCHFLLLRLDSLEQGSERVRQWSARIVRSNLKLVVIGMRMRQIARQGSHSVANLPFTDAGEGLRLASRRNFNKCPLRRKPCPY